MNDNETKYLTALGDVFLIAAKMHKGNTPREIDGALRAGTHDNYYSIGTMAGLARDATIAAVALLLADGYIEGKTDTLAVSLTAEGARWYMREVLAIEPPAESGA